MSAPRILTYCDVLDALQQFCDGRGVAVPQWELRRAVEQAYTDFAAEHDWSFLVRPHRVHLQAPYETGTVAYDHTGGTYERQLTLSGEAAAWPSWAADGVVRISGVASFVDERKSDTVLTLDPTMNPGQDVDAATSYSIYRRWYPLPSDFVSLNSPLEYTTQRPLQEISLAEMLWLERTDQTTGDPARFAIAAVPGLYGSMGLWVHPPSSTAEPLDAVYKHRPRELRYSGKDAADFVGSVSLTAGDPGVTGVGTTFASGHIGSILRIASTTNRPSGPWERNPWVEERSIVAVTNTLAATMDANAVAERSDVGYVISDPIDLQRAAHTAFMRFAEFHLAQNRSLDNLEGIETNYRRTLFDSRSHDGRSRRRRIAGSRLSHVTRLANAKTRTRID